MANHLNSDSENNKNSKNVADQPDGLSGKSIYLLERLATFTVNKQSGIVYPADGMRKMFELEKTAAIKPQKMQLHLDGQLILIRDSETGNTIERFTASSIQDLMAFTTWATTEVYNNVLVIVVRGERPSSSSSEMYIFQCQSISAADIVNDIQRLRNEKMPTQLLDICCCFKSQ